MTISMIKLLSLGSLGLFSLSLAHADPQAGVAEAVKKLGQQSGYSWTYRPKTEGSQSGRRQGPMEGKTEKGGFTWLKGSAGDISYEAALKGDKMAVNYNGDWISTSDIGEDNGAIQRLKALKKPAEEAERLLGKTADRKKDSEGIYSGDFTP